ncbi:MAG: hypothetical protein AB1445_00200 [Bacillota bacterium]
METLTKDEAVICIMVSFLVLIAVAVALGILDASSAARLPGAPSFLADLFTSLARGFRWLSLAGLVAGLVGTVLLPSRPEA